MILESLIKNESALTLDCAKATLRRGGRVTIPDDCYDKAEVQNAISMGLVRLVGEPPAARPRAVEERTLKLRNAHNTRLTFDCVKSAVGPGEILHVVESKTNDREIRNALAWGYLVDVEAAPVAPSEKAPPVVIDEVKLADAEPTQPEVSATEPLKRPDPPVVKAPTPARPKVAAKAEPKANKRVTSRHDVVEGGGGDDDALFRPSEVIEEPRPKPTPKPRVMPPEEAVEAEAPREKKDRWLDIFDELDGKVEKKAEKKVEEEDDFLK